MNNLSFKLAKENLEKLLLEGKSFFEECEIESLNCINPTVFLI